MSRIRSVVLAAVLVAAAPTAAFADATLFLGANTTPANRAAKGFAVGMGVLLLGFEFEYSSSPDAVDALAPSLKTVMGNVLLQTPFEIVGFQPYFTTGAGGYRESLDTGTVHHQETNVAANVGGGVKVSLIGPLRLRLDYRLFKLAGGALNTPAHRVYAGVNLKF